MEEFFGALGRALSLSAEGKITRDMSIEVNCGTLFLTSPDGKKVYAVNVVETEE